MKDKNPFMIKDQWSFIMVKELNLNSPFAKIKLINNFSKVTKKKTEFIFSL